jgi:hypothetical protein
VKFREKYNVIATSFVECFENGRDIDKVKFIVKNSVTAACSFILLTFKILALHLQLMRISKALFL